MRLSLLVVLLCLVVATSSALSQGNVNNDSFNRAKRLLLADIYRDYHQTFYCHSTFNAAKKISHTAGYVPVKEGPRAYRLEWEHVVPAEAFGHAFQEWRSGDPACVSTKGKAFKGRRCAEKVNSLYRLMQADMHNLVPAIGEVNGLRSNYSYAMLGSDGERFGSCGMKIFQRKAEPPAEVRGDIARIYFYMNESYPGRGIISGKNRKMFEAWSRQDPVDSWECERERRIAKLQGNGNHFVSSQCTH